LGRTDTESAFPVKNSSYQPCAGSGKAGDVTAAMRRYDRAGDSFRGATMRGLAAILVTALCLVAAAGCSRHAQPPVGRWEGTYDAAGTMIAARLEIDAKGNIFVSAPDAENFTDTPDARAAIRTNLAQGLAAGWGDVQPRIFEFDGKTFRKPGGVAPQMEWDSSSNAMTLIVYLGMRSGIRVPLHPVKNFSEDPWPG
jgi:hypothetical protein